MTIALLIMSFVQRTLLDGSRHWSNKLLVGTIRIHVDSCADLNISRSLFPTPSVLPPHALPHRCAASDTGVVPRQSVVIIGRLRNPVFYTTAGSSWCSWFRKY